MERKYLIVPHIVLFIAGFYWCCFFAQHSAWAGEWWFSPTLIISMLVELVIMFIAPVIYV